MIMMLRITNFPHITSILSLKYSLSQQPCHVDKIGSTPITAVKRRLAWLVLGWVTAWEHHLLLTLLFYLFSSLLF